MGRTLAIRAGLTALVLLSAARSALAAMGILIPAYFGWWRTDEWDRVKSAAGRVKVLAIFNPDSGPGDQDPRYAALVTSAKAAGVAMVGYVGTDYTQVSTGTVKANVDKYFDWYPDVDGLFSTRPLMMRGSTTPTSSITGKFTTTSKARPRDGRSPSSSTPGGT
jgi:hypothetical protein